MSQSAMKLGAQTDDWKLNPRVVLQRLTNPTTTVTVNNHSFQEGNIDLQKIASNCDPQCDSCWTLIHQLNVHVAENHSQTNCEEIRESRKRKRKRNENGELSLPPPGEESDSLLSDDEMERDDVSSIVDDDDGDFGPNHSNEADLNVETVDQGQGQEISKRQKKRKTKLELLTTANVRGASSTPVAKNSGKIKKKKTSKNKRKNVKVSSNVKQNSPEPGPAPAANNQDDYVTKTGRVTRKPIKYKNSDSEFEGDQDDDSDSVSTNVESESDPLAISPNTSASVTVTLESSKIVKSKKKKISKIYPDISPDSNSDSEISEDEDFEIFKSELTSSTTRKRHGNKITFTCRKCKEEFIEKDEFDDHFKTHAENSTIVELEEPEGNMICGICNAIFPIISELTQHVRMTHELARLHECHICDLKFDLKELSQHFELFHPDQLPFACKICTDEPKLTFSGLQELKLHERVVHTKKKVYPCNQCSKIFLSRVSRKRHSEVHKKERKEHICNKCGKSFDTLSDLDGHNTTHIPKKNFICCVEDCGKRFTAQEVLDAHVGLAHGQGHEKSQPADTNLASTSTWEGRELGIQKMAPFACRFCTHTFATPVNLLNHLRKDHANLLVNKFNCYLCKSKFLDRLKLFHHMRSDHPHDKPFSCQICNMGFGSRYLLTTHIQEEHTGEKPFACPICKKGFVTKQRMEEHVATNQHTGEKLHKCDQCEKSYTCLTYLKTHKLSHEGKKPFICDQCEKSYTSSTYLKAHKLIHEGRKPFKCDQCGKCFGFRTSLANHLIIHKTTANGEKLKPYAWVRSHICQECRSCFRTAYQLRRHLKTVHNKTTASGKNLKPYACKEKDCNARLTMKSHLKTHAEIHSGVRSHVCQECGSCFRRAHHLTRHLKTQHKEEKETRLEKTTDD